MSWTCSIHLAIAVSYPWVTTFTKLAVLLVVFGMYHHVLWLDCEKTSMFWQMLVGVHRLLGEGIASSYSMVVRPFSICSNLPSRQACGFLTWGAT